MRKPVQFYQNPSVADQAGRYTEIEVDAQAILGSWRQSVFSYEWLDHHGHIKETGSLSPAERQKRETVETAIEKGQAIVKPVLGMGLMDHVEIGSGKAEFLTLTARGYTIIKVHILKSHESDFQAFRADINSGP